MTNGRKRKKTVPSTGSDPSEQEPVFPEFSEEQRTIIASLIKHEVESVTTELLKQLQVKANRVDELHHEVQSLKKRVVTLEDKSEDNEAYERRDTVVISGSDIPPASDNEDTAKVVTSLVKDKINLVIKASDISVAHRLGVRTASAQGTDKRKIVVKLCRREMKQDLLKASRTVRPNNIYISESLTRIRGTALFGLRQARKKYSNLISGCGSHDGKVYCWIRPPDANARSSKMFINTRENFYDLCRNTLKCDPMELVSNWPNY